MTAKTTAPTMKNGPMRGTTSTTLPLKTRAADPAKRKVAVAAAAILWLVSFTVWGANSAFYLITVFSLPVAAGYLIDRVPLRVRVVVPVLAIFILDDWLIGDAAIADDWSFYLGMALVWSLLTSATWALIRYTRQRAYSAGHDA